MLPRSMTLRPDWCERSAELILVDIMRRKHRIRLIAAGIATGSPGKPMLTWPSLVMAIASRGSAATRVAGYAQIRRRMAAAWTQVGVSASWA